MTIIEAIRLTLAPNPQRVWIRRKGWPVQWRITARSEMGGGMTFAGQGMPGDLTWGVSLSPDDILAMDWEVAVNTVIRTTTNI